MSKSEQIESIRAEVASLLDIMPLGGLLRDNDCPLCGQVLTYSPQFIRHDDFYLISCVHSVSCGFKIKL